MSHISMKASWTHLKQVFIFPVVYLSCYPQFGSQGCLIVHILQVQIFSCGNNLLLDVFRNVVCTIENKSLCCAQYDCIAGFPAQSPHQLYHLQMQNRHKYRECKCQTRTMTIGFLIKLKFNGCVCRKKQNRYCLLVKASKLKYKGCNA